MRAYYDRGIAVRTVCLLTIVLMCAMGVAQAVHAHPDESTAPHHACSICLTAHARLGTEMTFAPPVLAVSPLLAAAPESHKVSRSTEVHFIRPPPAA